MYGYKCEYCEGLVQPRLVDREVFKHKDGFVILENVVIGVCDVCGNRYYTADILHTVHQIATGKQKPERTRASPLPIWLCKPGRCLLNDQIRPHRKRNPLRVAGLLAGTDRRGFLLGVLLLVNLGIVLDLGNRL